jgi:hypothetical protein
MSKKQGYRSRLKPAFLFIKHILGTPLDRGVFSTFKMYAIYILIYHGHCSRNILSQVKKFINLKGLEHGY